MSEQVKIVAIAGSVREGSVNQRVLEVAVEGAKEAGADVRVVNMKEFPFPLYSQDLEADGMPAEVNELRKIFKESHGILIASPEYNGSFTPLLKNTIDWLSRPTEGAAMLEAFAGKTAAIMSASPGGLGGLRGLNHLRDVLSGIKVLVLPEQVAVGGAFQAFNEDGTLQDEKRQASVFGLGQSVVETARRLNFG